MFTILCRIIFVFSSLLFVISANAQSDEMNFTVANEEFRDLNLDDSIFYSIEDATKNPLKVSQLVLVGKGLTALPANVYKFKNLKSLDISHNRIASLSDSLFFNCVKLEALRYAGNQLTSLPKAVFSKFLKLLDVSENNLTKVSDSIRFCLGLEELDLHANDIVTLPSEKVVLKKLKSLILSENPLHQNSAWVFLQPNLKLLFLDETQLTTLDDAVCKASTLKFLNIEGAQIKVLPDCMCNLTHLKVIQLGDRMPKTEIDKLLKCLPSLKVR